MTTLPSDVADRLRAVYTANGVTYRRCAMLAGVLAVCWIGGVARSLSWLAVGSWVFCGALVALFLVLARRHNDPAKSPVMQALLERPDTIASVRKSVGTVGIYLHVRLTTGERLGLLFDRGEREVDRIRAALADRSPSSETRPPLPVPTARVVRS